MKPAQTDLREIHNYIAGELLNPSAAARRINLIDAAIQSLKEKPARFPLVRDDYLASKGFRVIVVKTHLVFFIIREAENAVSVMRVVYGRRDWARMLRIDIGLLSEDDIQF
jgi:plasmid stabilization system protein ParE